MRDHGLPTHDPGIRPDDLARPSAGFRMRIGPRREWVLAIPALVAFCLGLWDLDRQSMGGTEAITYWAAHLPLRTLLHVLRHVDVVHGVYYTLMHLVFGVFGDSTAVLRLPSVIGGAVAVALCAALAHRLTGSILVAFLGSGVLVALPVVDQYAQLGRSYSMVTALVAAATLLLLRCLDRPDSSRRWWVYTVVMVVVVYLHEFSMLVLAAHAATLLWSRVDSRTVRRWGLHALLTVVVAIPLIIVSKAQSRQVGYLARPTLSGMKSLALGFTGPQPTVAAVISVLMLITVVVALRRGESGVTLTRVALPLLVIPPALLLGESLVGTPLYGGIRYLLFGTLAVALLAGAGLATALEWVADRAPASSSGVRHAIPAVGTLVVAGLFLAQLPAQRSIHSVRSESQDLLAGAVYLQSHARSGDGVLYVPRSLSSMDLVYPDKLAPLRDVVQNRTPVQTGSLYGSRVTLSTLTRRVAALHRLWLVQRPHLTLAPDYARLLRREHLHARSRFHVKGILITLYETRVVALP